MRKVLVWCCERVAGVQGGQDLMREAGKVMEKHNGMEQQDRNALTYLGWRCLA